MSDIWSKHDAVVVRRFVTEKVVQDALSECGFDDLAILTYRDIHQEILRWALSEDPNKKEKEE